MASDQELVRATACTIVDKLNSGEVTPLDLLDVLDRRIAEVDGQVNALPTLCFDRARSHAKALMKKPVGDRGLLAGMPLPIKDLFDVEGVLNTQGSPIFKDRISTHSDLVVEHLEGNGAVVYAKSNTPEFGAGANTFNEVFGATRNPWDTSRSAAGSSGGAAAARVGRSCWPRERPRVERGRPPSERRGRGFAENWARRGDGDDKRTSGTWHVARRSSAEMAAAEISETSPGATTRPGGYCGCARFRAVSAGRS